MDKYWTYSVDGEPYYNAEFESQAKADQHFLDHAKEGQEYQVETIEFYYDDNGERVVTGSTLDTVRTDPSFNPREEWGTL